MNIKFPFDGGHLNKYNDCRHLQDVFFSYIVIEIELYTFVFTFSFPFFRFDFRCARKYYGDIFESNFGENIVANFCWSARNTRW